MMHEGMMSVDLSTEVSRWCSKVPSFGEVLNEIRQQRKLTQQLLGKAIYRSEAEASRWINNVLPKSLKMEDVRDIAERLNCSRVEQVTLTNAFICHLFNDHDIIDPDEF